MKKIKGIEIYSQIQQLMSTITDIIDNKDRYVYSSDPDMNDVGTTLFQDEKYFQNKLNKVANKVFVEYPGNDKDLLIEHINSLNINDLEKAILVATYFHSNQVDKGGNPYILHVLSVAMKVKTMKEKIVAILHDILEDTEITKEDLKKLKFSDEIIEAVECLTRQENESYMDFIRRIKTNDLSKSVKIEDLDENMDLRRLDEVTEEDLKRFKKYKKARKILSE